MANTRLTSAAADARALGATLPIRAVYEASKRTNFHAILFRRGALTAAPRSQSVPIGNLYPVSRQAADRAVADAGQIDAEGLLAFGKRVATGRTAPWHVDPESGVEWSTDAWWRIDIRSAQRVGDVKHVWEVARHRDLVVLARATAIEPDGPWAALLDELLTSWCEQNPPEVGVNWYSSLELALRAIAWAQILSLAGVHLSGRTRQAMDTQLYCSGRHLITELPYTLSSMKNNHLLGDSLGLIVLSRMFPETRQGQVWRTIGNRLFAAQLRRQMRPDGSMLEDSLSYHRFVLEMLAVRVKLGDASPSVHTALAGASAHLESLGVFDGAVPQYGDWDEGRVLAASSRHLDVAGSAALGLSLTGRPLPDGWFGDHDELAWYAERPPPSDASTSTAGRSSASGGIGYVHRGPWRVWFKVGSGSSHGHADLTSVCVEHGGRWVIVDPGTGTYNGPELVRNGFRASRGHSVARIHDVDQLEPHRAFRWVHTASGHLAPPLTVDGTSVLFGWHDAYERLKPSVRVGRAVLVDEDYVAIVEFVADAAHRGWKVTLPLAPGVELVDGALKGQFEVQLSGCSVEPSAGDEASMTGWFSPTYGSWSPSTWLTGTTGSVWGLGALPSTDVENGLVRVGELKLRPLWDADSTALEVSQPDGRVSIIRP